MKEMLSSWRHVFKLDPAKELTDEQLDAVCESETDAVIVGGTDDVTLDGVLDLLSRIRRHTVPCFLEISNIESVTPGFDAYFIPMVMNSQDKKWMMDVQHEAVKTYKPLLDFEETIMQGYCILNEEAKAFQRTNCRVPDEDDVLAYAYMAERMFHLPVFYMEYSGTYGDPELVQKVQQELKDTLLVYGGGITTPEQAGEMSAHADIIVVGDGLYTNFKQALKTVKAVKTTS